MFICRIWKIELYQLLLLFHYGMSLLVLRKHSLPLQAASLSGWVPEVGLYFFQAICDWVSLSKSQWNDGELTANLGYFLQLLLRNEKISESPSLSLHSCLLLLLSHFSRARLCATP